VSGATAAAATEGRAHPLRWWALALSAATIFSS